MSESPEESTLTVRAKDMDRSRVERFLDKTSVYEECDTINGIENDNTA